MVKSAARDLDPITTGRIGVDLYPLRTGVPLALVEMFGKFPEDPAKARPYPAGALRRTTACSSALPTGAEADGLLARDTP